MASSWLQIPGGQFLATYLPLAFPGFGHFAAQRPPVATFGPLADAALQPLDIALQPLDIHLQSLEIHLQALDRRGELKIEN